MLQQKHILTQLESRLSFGPAISLCNEPPALCGHITLYHQRGFSFTYCTQRVEFSKIGNRANAQGKYNTISASTVARHLWSRENIWSTVPFFCECRNHFMQVKWYVCSFLQGGESLPVKWRVNPSWISAFLSFPTPTPSISSIYIVLCHFSEHQCALTCFGYTPLANLQTKIECGITILLCHSISKSEMCHSSV